MGLETYARLDSTQSKKARDDRGSERAVSCVRTTVKNEGQDERDGG